MKKLFFLSCIALIFSCKKNNQAPINEFSGIDFQDKVTKIEFLGEYSAAEASTFIQLASLPSNVKTICGFKIYRFSYKTLNFDNSEIIVSGLMAIPKTESIKGIVCWNHGTNVERNNAPSKPTNFEGIPIASLFAGDGYILMAADYIGLGISNEIPTYLNTPLTVKTVTDFLAIGSKVLHKLTNGSNNNLFITGFSQGGCVSNGLQRSLEISNQTGLNLRAVASIDGAYNLKDIAIKFAIQTKTLYYLGYIANSYAHMYGQNLNTIIKPEYVSIIPTLFNGSATVEEIEIALPKEPNQLYTDQMLTDIENGTSNWFTDALEQNEAYNYKPNNPLRLYYGTNGTDVSPDDAIATYNHMIALDGNVKLVNVGNFSHTETLLNSLPNVQSWFDTFK